MSVGGTGLRYLLAWWAGCTSCGENLDLWPGGVVMFDGGCSFGGHLQVALLLHFVTFGLPAAKQICETSSGTEHILMKSMILDELNASAFIIHSNLMTLRFSSSWWLWFNTSLFPDTVVLHETWTCWSRLRAFYSVEKKKVNASLIKCICTFFSHS